MPRNIQTSGERNLRCIVNDKQLPCLRRKGLAAQGIQYSVKVVWSRIMCTNDDGCRGHLDYPFMCGVNSTVHSGGHPFGCSSSCMVDVRAVRVSLTTAEWS